MSEDRSWPNERLSDEDANKAVANFKEDEEEGGYAPYCCRRTLIRRLTTSADGSSIVNLVDVWNER